MFCVCLFASAQEDNKEIMPLDSLHHIQNVCVLGHNALDNLSSSKPIQLMTREEIDLLGLSDLADVVKRFAGASVKDYGGIGGMKTVSVRNLGAHHTAISYDGFTLSNTQAGQIDIGRLSIENAEQISFAIGNEETFMQTARHYASAGVLSIQTEKPSFKEGKNNFIKGSLRVGSFGLVNPSLCYWQRMGNQTTLSVDGAFTRADGTYPFTLVNGKNKSKEKRHNSDINAWRGEINLYHTFGDGSQWDSKACWYYSERGLPGSVTLYNPLARERLWDEDFFLQTAFSKRLSKEWKLIGRGKYTHSWNRYEDTDVKYAGGKQTDISRQDEYYGSVVLGWLPSADFRLSLSQDLFWNRLRSNVNISANYGPSNPERFTSLTALSFSWAANRHIDIDGNLVGTFATEHVECGRQPEDRHRISPSFSATFSLPGYENLRLRIMTKGTFRMPSFNDLYYIRMGNTGLKPEKAKEYNIGITWNGRIGRHWKYLGLTLDGYYNDVKDKIVAFPTTYVWKMANFGKVHIVGIDATLDSEIGLGKKMDLVVNGTYSFQQAKDKLESSPTYGSLLPYIPKHSGNLSLILKNPWVNIGYTVMMQGKRWSSPMNKKIYELKAYWEHSLTLSHKFRLCGADVEVIGTLHNIFNEQYEIIQYYPMPGRNGELKVRFSL